MIFGYVQSLHALTPVWHHIKNMTLDLQIKELKQARQWQCSGNARKCIGTSVRVESSTKATSRMREDKAVRTLVVDQL
jgi:hypothetical protein